MIRMAPTPVESCQDASFSILHARQCAIRFGTLSHVGLGHTINLSSDSQDSKIFTGNFFTNRSHSTQLDSTWLTPILSGHCRMESYRYRRFRSKGELPVGLALVPFWIIGPHTTSCCVFPVTRFGQALTTVLSVGHALDATDLYSMRPNDDERWLACGDRTRCRQLPSNSTSVAYVTCFFILRTYASSTSSATSTVRVSILTCDNEHSNLAKLALD